MGDKSRGLYAKYDVTRKDGSDMPGEKHHDCPYFVLDLEHDPLALPAVRAYANAARGAGYGLLADDLQAITGLLRDPSRTDEPEGNGGDTD